MYAPHTIDLRSIVQRSRNSRATLDTLAGQSMSTRDDNRQEELFSFWIEHRTLYRITKFLVDNLGKNPGLEKVRARKF